MTSKAASEITAVNVKVGDLVQEGDVLVTLDSASIKEKIAELEKTVSNTDAVSGINTQQAADAVDKAVKDQETSLTEAQRNIDSAQDAYNLAQAQYDADVSDDTYIALLSAKRSLEAAKEAYDNTVDSTNRAIEDARTQLELQQYQNSDSTSKDTLSDLREQLEDCEIKLRAAVL